jgi:hypothetical protein
MRRTRGARPRLATARASGYTNRAVRLSRSDLIALRRKYQTLGELRRSRYGLTAAEARSPLQGLAREFPGALRELDTLSSEEIDRRELALGGAAESGTPEAWMEWMAAYHLTMRVALRIRRRAARRADAEVDEAWDLGGLSWAERSLFLDAGFVEAVLYPPEGRVNRVVFKMLESMFGESERVIVQALFPARRSARS